MRQRVYEGEFKESEFVVCVRVARVASEQAGPTRLDRQHKELRRTPNAHSSDRTGSASRGRVGFGG
jgi:hypothetical protein